MKKIFSVALLAIALLLFSCSEKAPIQKRERTAVLFSSLAEIWLEAGGSIDITVGETVERGFAPAGTPLVDSGAGKSLNAELLLSYKPTLVICSADIPAQAELSKLLKGNGIEVLSLRIESLDDYLLALDAMTDITGNKSAYKNAEDIKDVAIQLIKSREIQAVKGKKIVFFRAGSTSSSTKTKTSQEHFAAAMLRELGCVNIADDATISELGLEAILAADPEYIFFSLMGDEASAKANVSNLLSSKPWSQLSAVKKQNTFILLNCPKLCGQYKNRPNGRKY
ncbi:MAG: ABC transporter substrate-binding protein [Clostridia bacterium]|nr:ABC transporter substrate-binding protein [Clostridia bacterium]